MAIFEVNPGQLVPLGILLFKFFRGWMSLLPLIHQCQNSKQNTRDYR